MALLMKCVTPENVAGEWKAFGNTGIEAKLRPILPTKQKEIERRHSGSKLQLEANPETGFRKVEFDVDETDAIVLEKACFALVDTRGAEVTAEDDAEKAFFGKILGKAIEVGDTISLDGMWKEEVKRHVLAQAPNSATKAQEGEASLTFVEWIVRTAQEMATEWAARAASLKS
jgi:hypothetical protein